MAYQKTEWKNDSTPAISADSLNKMEGGIYDGHQNIEQVVKQINIMPFMTKDTHYDVTEEINEIITLPDMQLDRNSEDVNFSETSSMPIYIPLEGLQNTPMTLELVSDVSYQYSGWAQMRGSLSLVNSVGQPIATGGYNVFGNSNGNSQGSYSTTLSSSFSMSPEIVNDYLFKNAQGIFVKVTVTLYGSTNYSPKVSNMVVTPKVITASVPNRYKITL